MNTTALIVTFNRLDKLKNCWLSTSMLPFDNIVVVNNCSTDDTATWLESIEDSRLSVLSLTENTGGAGGFRKGVEYITSQIKTEWIFMYDDDAYPTPDLLKNFQDFTLDGISALSCRVIDANGIDCKMNKPFVKLPKTLWENVKYFLNPQGFIPDNKKVESCVTLSFVGTIVRQDVMRTASHYIHDDLFLYYDDVYFSHHLILNGHKFLYAPQLKFIHDISITGNSITPVWKVYYLVRNLLLAKTYFKCNGPYSAIGVTLRIVKVFSIVSKQDNKFSYLKYIIRGVVDGVFSKSGKRH
ncbi:glycosyl transferase family 2 [Rahnella variigena]|jgi:GT2 family glycosyltransferase|uniref:glycosyltransferase n=1 Tax=Rahnella variigena TaxID=574964 RepID=UPI00101B5D29|nr:glycosyltransferase [Rahnella variigena]RYJ17816.1 glycosyl transferase family 2 [Rahnella variigena]